VNTVVPTSFLRRAWYFANIADFLTVSDDVVLAQLVRRSEFQVLQSQRDAWLAQLPLLRAALSDLSGRIYLEFTIPRMGHRVDAVLFIQGQVLVVEFKIGAREHTSSDIDQAYDYAIDLKYFHGASHKLSVVPILVATQANPKVVQLIEHNRIKGLYKTVCATGATLACTIRQILCAVPKMAAEFSDWENSRYCPTPTIVEAARSLYAGHNVADISRCDAGAINLRDTSDELERIIEDAKANGQKAICFVTGVPGAGKTLVGLNIATQYNDPESELHSVFLSGNGPLVAILREALARDNIRREKVQGNRIRKGDAATRVKSFIQNVHHFRDECLRDHGRPPVDHVVIFDEAQRAWNQQHTAAFMHRKKRISNFNMSEPEFLISCMDRHEDWAVIICLVGGGQEINTGEAGIGEWIDVLRRSFNEWHVFISRALTDAEYGATTVLAGIQQTRNVHFIDALHLSVSVRSFRAEKVSAFVKMVLDRESDKARSLLSQITAQYPIVLTRNLDYAKQWLRNQASGSERYGIVVSSQAERLKPYALDVRTPVSPVSWFLDGKNSVRSSYYLEDVATEFDVQGLELDWACVCWDGDFRSSDDGWRHFSFRGTKWQRINQPSRRNYLKNAYRVLLTRARQGMVLFVPEGSVDDQTRLPDYYDSTFAYLRSVGVPVL